MRWFERYYDQTAVYWAPSTPDGTGGRVFGDPVEIDVRWEDKQVLFEDALGEEKLSRAAVYSKIDLTQHGYLYLGEEADLESYHGDPTVIDGAFEIKMISKTPDLTASYFLRTSWL